jgi:hypothetical protein
MTFIIYLSFLILIQLICIQALTNLADFQIASQDLRYLRDHNEKCKFIVFKENKTNSHRLIELDYESKLSVENIVNCYLYGDPVLAENAIIQRSVKPEIKFIGEEEMDFWINTCTEFLINSKNKKTITVFSSDDFPEEFNNQIDRNFFNGLLVSK